MRVLHGNSLIHQQGFKEKFHSNPKHDTGTNTEWQLPEVVLIQSLTPDDEHEVLETCRELKIKINT
jgi:hypothetical protein